MDQAFSKRMHSTPNRDLPYLTPFALREFVCDVAQDQYCGPNINPRNREVAEVFMAQENYGREIPITISQLVSMQRRAGSWADQFFINITSELLKIPIQITTDTNISTEARICAFLN